VHAITASGAGPRQPRKLRQAEDAALKELPFPRYQIALVQDESEMILQPAYDLFPFLSDEADARWEVELYTERTFEALLSADEQFDCIVLGLNTAWKSKIVRDALSKRLPGTGLCVLHQRGQGSLPYLSGELGLDVREFEEPIDRVMVAEQLEAADEILLNYPYRIPLGQTERQECPWSPPRPGGPTNKEGRMITIGIDPHPRTHSAAALDAHGRVLGELTVGSNPRELDRLMRWIAGLGPHRTVAVEGARGFGLALSGRLLATGETVLDVPPARTAMERRAGVHDCTLPNMYRPH
jgi:hypothetical protein